MRSQELVDCWACGAREVGRDPLLVDHGFLRCGACGLRFAPERDADSLRALYGDEYFADYDAGEEYDEHADRRQYESRLRLGLIRRHVTSGRLLEVGSAKGYFLAAARDSGFDVTGIEPAPGVAAEAGERHGVTVHTGFLGEVDLGSAQFDAVCAWHVLEHIPHPLEAVQRLRELTRPGGIVALEVPNGASAQADRMGMRWPHWQLRHHVAHYTPDGLRALLQRAGLDVLDLHTFPVTGYYEPARALRPLQLANYAKEAVVLRALPRRRHPSRHELVRAVARRP